MRRTNRRRAALGRVLRKARKVAGLTLEELADEVGVTRTTVHGYEMGIYEPPGLRLIDVAQVLRVNLDQLPQSVMRR